MFYIKKPPDISNEYNRVNVLLLAFIVVFLLYPLGVSLPEIAASFLPFNLPTLPSLLQQYPGLPCSSCGLTRSVVSLYHGNLEASLDYNPAGLFIILLAVIQLLFRILLLKFMVKNPWLSWFDLVQLSLCGVLIRAVLDVHLLLDQ